MLRLIPAHKLTQKSAARETGAAPDDVPENYNRAIDLIGRVCGLAGSLTFLDDIRVDMQTAGIIEAVDQAQHASNF
jgi:hypothetical protein